VGRPRPDVQQCDLDPIQGQGPGHGASEVLKIALSRSISSAILAWSSKLMVGSDSMGPGLQHARARLSNILLAKQVSYGFKLRRMSIFHEIQMAIFP